MALLARRLLAQGPCCAPPPLHAVRAFSASAPAADSASRGARLAVRYLPLAKWDLPAGLQFTRVDGAVHNPKVGVIARSRIRKAALLAMADGDTSSAWNHDWDRPLVAKAMRPYKSTIGRDAKVAERCVYQRARARGRGGGGHPRERAPRAPPPPSSHRSLPFRARHRSWLCRLSKIAANLALQDKKRADYKKTLPAKPLKQGLLQWIKKTACACAAPPPALAVFVLCCKGERTLRAFVTRDPRPTSLCPPHALWSRCRGEGLSCRRHEPRLERLSSAGRVVLCDTLTSAGRHHARVQAVHASVGAALRSLVVVQWAHGCELTHHCAVVPVA